MKKFLLGLALAGLMAFNASATQITDSDETTVLIGSGFGLTLSQFLSAGALIPLNPGEAYVLNWWQLQLETQVINTEASFENRTATTASFTLNILGTVTLNNSPTATGAPVGFTQNSNLVRGPANVGAFDGVIDFGGTSGVSLPVPVSGPLNSTNSAQLVDFTGVNGAGSFVLNFLGTDGTTLTGPGVYAASTGSNQFTRVTVTYDYDIRCIDQGLCGGGGNEVPEPTTMALMGIGLVGLGFIGRRLRK